MHVVEAGCAVHGTWVLHAVGASCSPLKHLYAFVAEANCRAPECEIVTVQVAGQYLEFLVSQERFEEAAALMPRLLKVCTLSFL